MHGTNIKKKNNLHQLFVLCSLSPVHFKWHNKTTKLIPEMFCSLASYLWLLNTYCHLLLHVPVYVMCFETCLFQRLHAHIFGQRKQQSPWLMESSYSFISIQPLGRFSRNQSSVRRPVWLWHTASWASFLGVGCHYFPPPLDIPTFVARCLHIHKDARDPSSKRWNCGQEMLSSNFAEITISTPFRDLLHAANLRHGTNGLVGYILEY